MQGTLPRLRAVTSGDVAVRADMVRACYGEDAQGVVDERQAPVLRAIADCNPLARGWLIELHRQAVGLFVVPEARGRGRRVLELVADGSMVGWTTDPARALAR